MRLNNKILCALEFLELTGHHNVNDMVVFQARLTSALQLVSDWTKVAEMN
jgi:hypothetical protein